MWAVKTNMKPPAVIAVGDPSVVDFNVIDPKDPRQIRLVGQRIGTTDLSIVTADNRIFAFEIHVVPDLDPLRAKLREHFPDAQLKLSQNRHQLIVEGQARDTAQVANILEMVRAYQASIRSVETRKIKTECRAGVVPQRQAREGEPAAAAAVV